MWSRSSRQHERAVKAVTHFLVKDMIPISVVEGDGFRNMISQVNPRFDLPHKDYFSRVAIPALYEETCRQLEEKLSQCSFYSAKTDLWTSCTSEPYLVYTIHFIDNTWKIHSYCLKALYVPEDHTGESLQEAFHMILSDWYLDKSKQGAITSDSGSNIKRAFQLLGWTNVSCFGHNLDLAINKGLKDH